MSFSTGYRKCQKCGKMYLMSLFDGGLCAECEKAEQDDMPCITHEELQKCKDIVKKYTPKQEPCDDAVSRQAILDKLNEWEWQELYLPIHFKENIIDELPSVRPQEQTGHWIRSKDGYMRCDQCGSRGSAIKARFCHHCGCRMVEPTCETCEYNTAALMPCNECDDKSEYKPRESERINCKSTKCENCQNHNYCDFEPQESEE